MAGYEESLEDQIRRMVVSGHGQPPPAQPAPRQQAPQSFEVTSNGRNPMVPPDTRHHAALHTTQHGTFPRGPGYRPGPFSQSATHRQSQGHQRPMDPNAFHRGGQIAGYYQQSRQQPRQLYDPNTRRGPQINTWNDVSRQADYLNQLAGAEISRIDMTQAESAEKEAFRATLQSAIHNLCAADDRLPKISLECFGSFKSGFATAGSDMDLVIVLQDGTPYTACFSLLEDDLPRALEKHLLNMGFGARLLTRTRVPIIKICEKPDDCLLDKLRAERYRWETLPNEKKYPHLHQNEDDEASPAEEPDAEPTPVDTGPATEQSLVDSATNPHQPLQSGSTTAERGCTGNAAVVETPGSVSTETITNGTAQKPQQRKRDNRPFTRERKAGPLDFPKDGVGIQCDINFFNPLGLHNTQLLRCYSLCDPRVRPMVLFVKAWAKRRKINSSYSGTLSSYGFVLMVLHYLVNVAQPPVLPNLQMSWRPSPHCTPQGATRAEVDGHMVDFWRNENEIMQAVQNGQMSSNRESIGALLSNFFRYFSSQGGDPQFHWMQDVLSLRSPGGLLKKEEKGWVKAITEDGEGKKVQHRYLFCIEDPFETSHNVARTVTHQGIVAIRDEFRRAYRILRAVGQAQQHEHLFAYHLEAEDFKRATALLKQQAAFEAQSTNVQVELQNNIASNQAAFAKNHGGTQCATESQRGRGRGRGAVRGHQHQQAQPPPNTADEAAFLAIGTNPRRGAAHGRGVSQRPRGAPRPDPGAENAAPVTRMTGYAQALPIHQPATTPRGEAPHEVVRRTGHIRRVPIEQQHTVSEEDTSRN